MNGRAGSLRAEAYRFLIFNYDPRDEICLLGFSRRSQHPQLHRLIRPVGLLHHLHVSRIDETIKLYRDADEQLRRSRAYYSCSVCVDGGADEWRRTNVGGYGHRFYGDAELWSVIAANAGHSGRRGSLGRTPD